MSQPRRVLFISPQPFFAWRGSSIRVKFDVQALSDLGYQVDLLTIPLGEDEPTPARVIRVWNLLGSQSIAIGPSPLKLWFDLLLLIRGLGLILRNRYSAIHGTEETGFLAWILARLCGAKAVYEKHSDAASYKKRFVQNLLLRGYVAVEHFTCRHADLVICTGPGLARQAASVAPNARIHDIPDIPSSLVEPEAGDIDAASAAMRSSPDQIVATYVGSFAVYQGIDVLFEAMPQVLSSQPRLRFVVIGGSETEITARRRALEAAGADLGRIVFLGLIAPDKLPAYLAASDILLAPRKAGVNTPLKVLDYFKAGGAIVATDTPANRFILDESCARLSEFSAAGFADAISELAADGAERERIAAEGRRRFETTFNFDEFSRLLGVAYADMLSE